MPILNIGKLRQQAALKDADTLVTVVVVTRKGNQVTHSNLLAVDCYPDTDGFFKIVVNADV